jgi:DNA adenine methylase
MMDVPQPIPYQGSKRGIANKILDCFPKDVDRVIEPFAGSAAVSISAAFHKKAKRFLLNDRNEPLMQLWDKIINKPDEIADAYEKLWKSQKGQERSFFNYIRDEFNKNHEPHLFLFLLARIVKGAIRYNRAGMFNQSPDNRRKGRHPNLMKHDIVCTSRLLKGRTELFALDYKEILAKVDKSDIVYMDPPYQGVCGQHDQRYFKGVEFRQFVKDLEVLNQKEISFIVSYDGFTGEKKHGEFLPEKLGLTHIMVNAGRSTQATFLGQKADTIESLYLSPALVSRLRKDKAKSHKAFIMQKPLMS